MTDQMHSSLQAYEQLLQAEFQDSLDEELEMELDDARMDGLIARAEGGVPLQPGDLPRRTYFSELLRLQGELVKLQDWVVHNQLKVVVLFEGRDAAGKGGRDQARHSASQSAYLPGRGAARAERPRAYPVVLPALRVAPARRR